MFNSFPYNNASFKLHLLSILYNNLYVPIGITKIIDVKFEITERRLFDPISESDWLNILKLSNKMTSYHGIWILFIKILANPIYK